MSMGSVRERGKTWTWYLDIGPDPLTGGRQAAARRAGQALEADRPRFPRGRVAAHGRDHPAPVHRGELPHARRDRLFSAWMLFATTGVRHTYATVALQAGVPVKVVSEQLGHASIAVTLKIYAHVLPGMDRDTANAVAGVILGTTKGPANAAADPSVDKTVDRKLFHLDPPKRGEGAPAL